MPLAKAWRAWAHAPPRPPAGRATGARSRGHGHVDGQGGERGLIVQHLLLALQLLYLGLHRGDLSLDGEDVADALGLRQDLEELGPGGLQGGRPRAVRST